MKQINALFLRILKKPLIKPRLFEVIREKTGPVPFFSTVKQEDEGYPKPVPS